MGSVSKTTTSTGEVRYRVRYRDPEGRSREKWERRKVDAEAFLTQVEGAKLDGTYLDPQAGRMTFGEYAQGWLAAQTFDDSTREGVEARLRLHILPTFGSRELRSIQPSQVQAWLRGRQQAHRPAYVRLMLVTLSAVLAAAVDDGRIRRNPCATKSVTPPAVVRGKVVPWTTDMVLSVVDGHPEEFRLLPMLGAGAGLRQGEAFGLRSSDVEFLRRVIEVRQQVKIVGGQVVIAPPKRGKTRTVPLSETLAIEISKHPTDGLLTTYRGEPLKRHRYNEMVWRPALRKAGIEPGRENGFHALRHHFASVLLDAGVSIRALAEYLGHTDPGFTLRVYTHLMPASEDRARQAIDSAFCGADVGLGASGTL